jgi:AraC-like DNA-binding protein
MTKNHSRNDGGARPSRLIEINTDLVSTPDRFEFWSDVAGTRMRCVADADATLPMRGQVRAISGAGADFMDYAAQSFLMHRTQAMCDRDGRDEISIGLVVGARTGAILSEAELSLTRGELYAIDFGRPVSSAMPNHHELAIALPRRLVHEALGVNLDSIGGRILSTRGIGGLLASHMRALAAQAIRLTPEERTLAMRTAVDLALATLQASVTSAVDQDRYSGSMYGAALAAIDRNCGDHGFSPQKLAGVMGCSRASLYRLFSRHGEGVAAAIWSARLDRAHNLLLSPDKLSVSEASFRSGFRNLSSFGRMYRRRYGCTPRET